MTRFVHSFDSAILSLFSVPDISVGVVYCVQACSRLSTRTQRLFCLCLLYFVRF